MKISNLIIEYVSFKQAMGMRYQSEARIFRSFSRTLGDVDISEVDSSAIETFLPSKGPVTSTWYLKYTILNGFFRFATNRRYIDSSPLPKSLPKRPEPHPPHIYSIEELRRFQGMADLLKTPKSPLQAETFKTLFLTLYGTGLRISEALSLTLANIDLPESLLIVRNSKFFKTRIVPTGPRLTELLRLYFEKRRRLPCPLGEDSAFFSTRTGHPISYRRVGKIFRLLRNRAGITRREGTGYGPTIHNLRHTFTVHRLESWYREGADVQRLLPRLSTYLGHVDVAETQCYLVMTPDLLREANRRFEQYAQLEVRHV
ncbi:MAG: tyrosine-type recombinase/integrase [Deltaproteobacteria bacterium]|nr:tyrosine-type recombinase/integrase [Deltaproteobacteria bacterium]